jgi:hypothetical protein
MHVDSLFFVIISDYKNIVDWDMGFVVEVRVIVQVIHVECSCHHRLLVIARAKNEFTEDPDWARFTKHVYASKKLMSIDWSTIELQFMRLLQKIP